MCGSIHFYLMVAKYEFNGGNRVIKEERICHLCGTSESEEVLYKVNEPDSECHGLWLCLACYVDELAEEPNDTQNTEDDDAEYMYEPEYEPDYDDIDDMDDVDDMDDDIDDILKEMFNE